MSLIQIILTAAKTVKISGAILVAVCSHESGLTNTITPHDGGSPSIGICQVKHDTAVMLGYQGSPDGLLDPKTNAKYAAIYLKFQYNRYQNWCKAIAAYNAGRYNESEKEPGHPKNLKYVLNVSKKLNKRFQQVVSCDTIYTGETDVAENNGFGLRVQPTKP
jgi:soluble lytic murein transglycosylase-like protein